MPSRILTPLERVGHGVLRRCSTFHRAYTDLFVEPYVTLANWQSGLGDHGHCLYGLARALRPTNIVEIGTARGRSACIFALACAENRHGRVHAIDPHKPTSWSDQESDSGTLSFLRDRLRQYDLERYCRIMATTSEDAASGWTEPVDLLFIDGDHSYAGVRRDFDLFRPWLSPDALVCFHDSSWEHEGPWSRFSDKPWYREDMGVPRLLEELQAEGYESVTLPATPGLTVLYPDSRRFVFRRQVATGP